MPAPVEKYKLTKEQQQYTKQYKQVQKVRKAIAQGIQYKMSELRQLQQVAQGYDQKIAEFLQMAPTDGQGEVKQPDAANLVINY
jgi:hypothetical protein